MGGRGWWEKAVRELIGLDELALMQSLCHSSAGTALVNKGSSVPSSPAANVERSNPHQQHDHQPLRPPTRSSLRANTHLDCHRGTHDRHELQDNCSVRPSLPPPAADRRHVTTTVSLTARRRLYRRSLKLALDWAVHRYLWRGQAMYIRSLFEANKNVTEPRRQRVRCKEYSLQGSIADACAGFDQGDGESPGEVEASRSVPSTHGAWR